MDIIYLCVHQSKLTTSSFSVAEILGWINVFDVYYTYRKFGIVYLHLPDNLSIHILRLLG